MTVEPDVDLGPGTVLVVTPFGNLRDRAFWVTRNLGNGTFTIRMSDTRNRATPFSWLAVENEALAAEIETAQADAAAAEEEAATE